MFSEMLDLVITKDDVDAQIEAIDIVGDSLQRTRNKELKKWLIRLPVCDLTIAFEPTKEVLRDLGRWVRKNLDKEAVLRVTVDPGVMAGVEIAFKGRYKDLTVKAKIDDLFPFKGAL